MRAIMRLTMAAGYFIGGFGSELLMLTYTFIWMVFVLRLIQPIDAPMHLSNLLMHALVFHRVVAPIADC